VVTVVIRGSIMTDTMIVSEVARELTDRFGVVVRPRAITNLFYQRLLSDDRCPILGGRRVIARDYLPVIEGVLRERGVLPGPAEEACL
jgi:hypothetical protein